MKWWCREAFGRGRALAAGRSTTSYLSAGLAHARDRLVAELGGDGVAVRYPAVQPPLSRRTLITCLWVGVFVVLGLVGFRVHTIEAVTIPAGGEGPTITHVSELGPIIATAVADESANGSVNSGWHLDLLAILLLSLLASMVVVLFLRGPWARLLPRRFPGLGFMHERRVPSAVPLRLLLSVSRT